MKFQIGIFIILTFCCCYRFTGISIDADTETINVSAFEDQTKGLLAPPPNVFLDFTEALRDKIRSETRLKQTATSPHLEISGAISNYNQTYVAPTGNNEASTNRLQVSVSVTFKNNLNSDKDWTQSFTQYEDFPIDANLLDVQDELINSIFERILEDIFRKAFGNW